MYMTRANVRYEYELKFKSQKTGLTTPLARTIMTLYLMVI
jgi:hypothetical protein